MTNSPLPPDEMKEIRDALEAVVASKDMPRSSVPYLLIPVAKSYRAAYERMRTARLNYDAVNDLMDIICAQSYPDPVLWPDEINDLQYELCTAFDRAWQATSDLHDKAMLEVFAAHGLEDGPKMTTAADGTPKYDLTCPKTAAAWDFITEIEESVKEEK